MSGIENAIYNGEYDQSLDQIAMAIQIRRDMLRPKATDFKVGEKVRYNSHTRPKYLAGATGVIQKINRTKVTVMLDKPTGRFYGPINTPTSLIEKV